MWIAVGCLKCFLHCLVILEHRVCVWSAYRRLHMYLVLYEMMKRSVFMHMSVLATAERACFHFVSYFTPPYPHIITLCFNPSPALWFPSFYPQFPLGMWLVLHRLFVHTAQVTLRIGSCVCLGSSGKRKRQRQALKLSHRYKNQQRKCKYGLLHGMRHVGSRQQAEGTEIALRKPDVKINVCGKLKIYFWICSYFNLKYRYSVSGCN